MAEMPDLRTTHPTENIRLRVRFDFKGYGKARRLFRAGKSAAEAAEDVREEKIGLLRNVPVQGIEIEDVDRSYEVYTVHDDDRNEVVAYAPVVLVIRATSVENVVKFVMREEFRKLEVLEPASINLPKATLERLLFRVNEEYMGYRRLMERKLENWK